MQAGVDLRAEHPGFSDAEYRKRRMNIAEMVSNYQLGQGEVPRVAYSTREIATWKVVFEALEKLHEQHACSEFLSNKREIRENCSFGATSIPQLADINSYLSSRTGFLFLPVSGMLKARTFLNSLAFRVFPCTQYLRHSSQPSYTPEPDLVHELLGHTPMFADRDFAAFSQEIGLASLGASEEDIGKLAACYLFSVEFGVIAGKEQGRKIYGAGILSSVQEINNAIRGDIPILQFDPVKVANLVCPLDTLQEFYCVSTSFGEMKERMRTYAGGIQRGFQLTYNEGDNSVSVHWN